jgi:hypothetical protein
VLVRAFSEDLLSKMRLAAVTALGQQGKKIYSQLGL